MNRVLYSLCLILGLSAALAHAREELLPLTETRSITINVPDGFNYKAGVNQAGGLALTVIDGKQTVVLNVSFEPDPEELYRPERSRKERLHREYAELVENSVEKAMQFEELKPKVGAATYCLFTDAKLAGKPVTEYPPGEYLHVTAGVKAWPGIVAIFTVFSNDTESAAYRTLLQVIRESVHEKPAPLL